MRVTRNGYHDAYAHGIAQQQCKSVWDSITNQTLNDGGFLGKGDGRGLEKSEEADVEAAF